MPATTWFPDGADISSSTAFPTIFDSGRTIIATRYNIPFEFGVRTMSINLRRAGGGVSDTLTINWHSDNGSQTAPSSTVLLAGTDAPAPPASLTGLPAGPAFGAFSAAWGAAYETFSAGVYWSVITAPGGPHSGIEGLQPGVTASTPCPTLIGSSLGSLSPMDVLFGDTDPAIMGRLVIEDSPVVAAAARAGWVTVIG